MVESIARVRHIRITPQKARRVVEPDPWQECSRSTRHFEVCPAVGRWTRVQARSFGSR